jgi:ParB/RepB/Spo0J family partition protein
MSNPENTVSKAEVAGNPTTNPTASSVDKTASAITEKIATAKKRIESMGTRVTPEADSDKKEEKAEVVSPDRLLYLLPEDISIPEDLDVRPWTSKGGSEKEVDAIASLAATISAVGQISPIKVRYKEGGGFELIAGRRRIQAVALINAGQSKGEIPIRIKAIISSDDPTSEKLAKGRSYRQAMVENLHRENLSPMDLAMDIDMLRKKFKWLGSEGTKKIAEFLKVSPATVIQHTKLLELPENIQTQVHEGTLSREAAFALVDVKPEKRQEVIDKAKEKQKAETQAAKAEPTAGVPANKPSAASGRDTKTVKTRHVKAAAREVEGATEKPQTRTRKELLDYFSEKEGPAYGHADGAVQTFIRELILWAKGLSTDRKLDKLWDAMVERAPKGTREVAKPIVKAPAKKSKK